MGMFLLRKDLFGQSGSLRLSTATTTVALLQVLLLPQAEAGGIFATVSHV